MAGVNSRVESEYAEVKLTLTRYNAFGFAPGSLALRNLLETGVQRYFGVLHVVANFAPIEGRQ